MLRIPQLLKGPQGLLLGFCGLAAVVVAGPQQAQAVSISFTSAQVPSLCPSGTCVFDVVATSPITYAQLSTAYPPSLATDFSYNFFNTTIASTFTNAYQALVPYASNPANNGDTPTFGELPASPTIGSTTVGIAGGPLFFTGISTLNFGVGTVTQTGGQYFNGTSTNFSSNVSGTGVLSSTTSQKQVWAIYRCSGGSCIPVPSPLPILGASAAFGYSRRLRNRLQDSKA